MCPNSTDGLIHRAGWRLSVMTGPSGSMRSPIFNLVDCCVNVSGSIRFQIVVPLASPVFVNALNVQRMIAPSDWSSARPWSPLARKNQVVICLLRRSIPVKDVIARREVASVSTVDSSSTKWSLARRNVVTILATATFPVASAAVGMSSDFQVPSSHSKGRNSVTGWSSSEQAIGHGTRNIRTTLAASESATFIESSRFP